MRVLVALTLLAACGATEPSESRTGAFSPEDAIQRTSNQVRIAVDRTAVPLEQMPMGQWLAGLPMHGLATVKIDLAAPVKDGRTLFSQARGSFTLACDKACRLGDDVAKLAVRGQTLDIGHVDFEALALRGTVEDGHVKLTEWTLVSPDVKMLVDIDIKLADDLAASELDGCIQFAPVAGLEQRRPKTWAVVQMTGASADAAGMFSIKLGGTLGASKRFAQACDAQKVTVN